MTMTVERPLDYERRTDVPAMGRPPVTLRDLVSNRLRAPGSRELVARSLTQLVEDAFLVDARQPIPHLRDALDEPIAVATETAVETLIDELADLLDLLPDNTTSTWDRAGLQAELGYE